MSSHNICFLVYDEAQELEIWSEMHVKMAQIDYPIG